MLTAKEVEAAKVPGMYADGGRSGLYLRVGPTGGRSWIVRLVIHGQRRELGIGSVDHVTLAEARAKAADMRAKARTGEDPDAPRRAAKEAAKAALIEAKREAERARMTLAEAAKAGHAIIAGKLKNEKHRATWLSQIELHLAPLLQRPVHLIGQADLEAALLPVWTETPETARRILNRLVQVFDLAKARGHLTGENPAVLAKALLPQQKVEKGRQPAMPWRDVPGFMEQLAAREGISAQCLRFIILTAVRSGEARGARWSEIDLAERVWTIPGERMKAGKPHRVPLSDVALALLEQVNGLDPVLVFPSAQPAKDGSARPMSDMVFKSLFIRMGVDGFVTHGFRSSFRDWCSEVAHAEHDVAEAALAHKVGNAVSQAYARSDLLDRRRGLMDRWGAFCTGQVGQIVQLVRA